MDGDDEDKLYALIQADQKKAEENRDQKDKGDHLNDLVDKEMISLLNVCKRLHCPKVEALADKYVNFGPKAGTNQKVLVLDMDETMLHARFL